MKAGLAIVVAVSACGGESAPPLPPTLTEVPGTLSKLAINDSSLFSVDLDTNALLELSLDGVMIGTLPTTGEVIQLVAHGDLVAWVEVEGTGTVVKRRRGAGAIETQRTFEATVVATEEGLFYSDLGLIAVWGDGNPERIATPPAAARPRLLDVDLTFAYTDEDGAIVEYTRDSDLVEVQVETSSDATARRGQLAYRTAEGIRLRDLFTNFDRVVGFVPGDYACELLIVEQAVMCGRFRALNGNADELLIDPVGGYAARGRDVFWVTAADGVSSIRVIDAEATE
jgi:hypothetical protein